MIMKPASARTLLRLVLLVQLAAALLVAWLLLRRGVPAWGALPAGVAVVALVRRVINMNNFVMAARAASAPRTALDRRHACACWPRNSGPACW
jgi:hypothetical protein